ncbi:MAG TPA: hypothetical protein PKE27_06960 [Povalibacter sp.]|mgnify:CR=1 FL=1|uniref:hypothetical protein n=1 Tax=Povalibacter sp. TaxID=1962978 RepID=UPI002C7402F1|nr:hypothetical protein [Povalibacter sp.]HMN44292.1 hypothetical protein [Povalibacter sp.]
MNVDSFEQSARPVGPQASAAAMRRSRRERWWAWASLLVLIVAWDAAGRLDQKALMPVSARPTVSW